MVEGESAAEVPGSRFPASGVWQPGCPLCMALSASYHASFKPQGYFSCYCGGSLPLQVHCMSTISRNCSTSSYAVPLGAPRPSIPGSTCMSAV